MFKHLIFNGKCIKVILITMTFWIVGIQIILGQTPDEKKALDSLLQAAKIETAQMRYDKAVYIVSELLGRARPLEANAYLSQGYRILSQNQGYLRDSTFVEDYARKSLSYAIKSGNDTLKVNAYNNLGDFLAQNRQRREEAARLYYKALYIARKSYREKIAVPALNLARLYHDIDAINLMPRYLREAEENIQGLPRDVSDEEIRLNILWGEYFDHVGGENLVAEYWATAHGMIKNKNAIELALYFYPKYAWFLNDTGRSAEAYELLRAYQKIKGERDRHLQKITLQKAIADAGADELKRQRNQAKVREEFADKELARKKTQTVLMYIITGLLLLFLIYLFISMRSRKRLVKDLRSKNDQLTQAKETAEESVKAKSEFFSTVSHEMRTPLYGVTGMVDVIKSSGAVIGFEEEFNSLRFSAEHLLDVINDLLEISKLDDRTFEFNEHPFDLNGLILEIIKSFEGSNLKNTNTLHYEQDGLCPQYLIGDSRRIAQVLINLMSNAIKFTSNGDIYLRIICEDSDTSGAHNILFEVEDTGRGIPKDKLDYIFKEFNQVKSIDDEEQKMGTGLGLAIVKKILHKLNSDIRVTSKLGKGTIFSFNMSLQISPVDASIAEKLIVAEMSENREEVLRGAHILVVDDNRVNRLVTSRLLEQKGMRVSLAPSGLAAIDTVKARSIDLVLMDLHMPGMDGFDATLKIREFDAITPIVALTATEIAPIREKLNVCGFNDYVSKPFNAKEFYRILATNLIFNHNASVSID